MRRFGVALGRSSAWAAPAGRAAAPRGDPVRAIPLPDGWVETLGADLRAALGPGPARLDLVLLPDRCHLRWIPLPPLSRAEQRAVLERTLGRHVPGTGPWAFGTEPGPGGVLVAAAPLELVEALERTLTQAGFTLDSLRAAAHAWLAAAGGARSLLIAGADRIDLVSAPGGRVRSVRRLARSLATPAAIRQLLSETGTPETEPLAIVAAPADRETIGPAAAIPLAVEPHSSAAVFAGRAAGPEILTPEGHRRREQLVRRSSRRLLAAAAALAVAAAAFGWWGTARELAALRAARAAQSVAVAEALALRERVTRLDERLVALHPDRATDRAWSRVLADVAQRLPRTAFLTAFRGAGDSLSLEGYAREAGPVLEALRQSPAVAALRATAPIRRESGPGDAALDRFVLGVRLSPRSAP